MIPARYAFIPFSLILSGVMSLVVSGVSTFKTIGPIAGMPSIWLTNWTFCWAVAFPTALLVAPIARRIVGCVVCEDKAGATTHPTETTT